jgi:hypothetical protein
MTGVEIIMLMLISINAFVIFVELVSWTKYMNGLDREKKTNEYLKSEQFQKDKAERLEETYKMINRVRETKDEQLLCKNQKSRKSNPTPKGRNMIDKL